MLAASLGSRRLMSSLRVRPRVSCASSTVRSSPGRPCAACGHSVRIATTGRRRRSIWVRALDDLKHKSCAIVAELQRRH